MTMPRLLQNGRRRGLMVVTLVTLVQGAAAGVAAFATRGLFDAMAAQAALPPGLLVALKDNHGVTKRLRGVHLAP